MFLRERERKKKESGEILTPPNGCTRQNVKKSKNETQITRDSKKIETLRSCRGIKAVSTRYFRFFFLGCCFCCCRESVEKIPTGDKNHVFLALSVSVEGSNFLDKLQTQKKFTVCRVDDINCSTKRRKTILARQVGTRRRKTFTVWYIQDEEEKRNEHSKGSKEEEEVKSPRESRGTCRLRTKTTQQQKRKKKRGSR